MSDYSIYIDETGNFQGIDDFNAICGFIWKGDPGLLSDKLKDFCVSLSDWLKNSGNDDGKAFPECLHTTENSKLKNILNRHNPDLLQTRLQNLPIATIGIYAFSHEVNRAKFKTDALYRKMTLILIRRITEKIRQTDPNADITFHIPTRITVFDIDDEKKKQAFQQNDITVGTIKDKKTGNLNLQVSLNTPEAFIDIENELNIHCSVREIDYKITDPDRDDEKYHVNRNDESTLWGYYTADIFNYWARDFANDETVSPEDVIKNMEVYFNVYEMIPYSENIEKAEKAIVSANENQCGYLETLEELYAARDHSPRSDYCELFLQVPLKPILFL